MRDVDEFDLEYIEVEVLKEFCFRNLYSEFWRGVI